MGISIGQKTKGELINDTVNDLVASTPLQSVPQGSSLSGLITVIASKLEDVYDDIEANFSAGYTRTAIGTFLDIKAEDRGLTRDTEIVTTIATNSKILAIRTTDGTAIWSKLGEQTGTYRVIGKGIPIYSSTFPSISLSTNVPTFLTPSDTIIYIGAEGELEDSELISANTFDTFSWSSSSVFIGADTNSLEFIQSGNIIGVERVESDEELRGKINAWPTTVATGNSTAIEQVGINSSEVSSVVIEKNIRGTGSANVILIPRRRRVPQSVIDRITQDLIDKKSFTEDIRVTQPQFVPVSMTLIVASSDLVSKALSSIDTLFEELPIGARLSYNIIKSAMLTKGIPVTVDVLAIDGQELLPTSEVSLLNNEMFELDVPVRAGTFGSPVTVNIG